MRRFVFKKTEFFFISTFSDRNQLNIFEPFKNDL